MNLHQAVFDAVPFPMFVVGSDLGIRDFNDAALPLPDKVLLTIVRPETTDKRIGDILHCVNAADGCGNSTVCEGCSLVKQIGGAVSGRHCSAMIPMRLLRDGGVIRDEFLVSATPFQHAGERLVVVILQSETARADKRVTYALAGSH